MTESIFQTFDEVTTSATRMPVGTVIRDEDEVWELVLAGSALVAGQVVAISATGTAGTGVTHAGMGSGATPTKLGVVQRSAGIPSGSVGWVKRKGTLNFLSTAAVTLNTKLYTTATDGSLSNASTTQTLINGLVPTATTGAAGLAAGRAIVELSANCFA